MGIEETIQGLTDAVKALTKALAANHDILSSLTDKAVQAPKPAATPPASVMATQPPVAAEPAAASPSSAQQAPVDYAQVAKMITDTFQKDRAKVVAALAKFGAAKGPQLKAEDYAAFVKELA